MTNGLIKKHCAMLLVVCLLGIVPNKGFAVRIVVSHDINNLATNRAGVQEEAFAVNVATWLTEGVGPRNILLYESNPLPDGERNYATGVLNALNVARFTVTVTQDYTTPFSTFDAIFVAQDFPTVGFLDNSLLIDYAENGGGVYLAGGVGPSPLAESDGWSVFLNHFGLQFESTTYNNLTRAISVIIFHLHQSVF